MFIYGDISAALKFRGKTVLLLWLNLCPAPILVESLRCASWVWTEERTWSVPAASWLLGFGTSCCWLQMCYIQLLLHFSSIPVALYLTFDTVTGLTCWDCNMLFLCAKELLCTLWFSEGLEWEKVRKKGIFTSSFHFLCQFKKKKNQDNLKLMSSWL
jgi:hypothetical protein